MGLSESGFSRFKDFRDYRGVYIFCQKCRTGGVIIPNSSDPSSSHTAPHEV